VLRLKKAEDMLQRHSKCSKCFALFVVIVVLLLCAIIIILAVKFPAAVAPTESLPAAAESTNIT